MMQSMTLGFILGAQIIGGIVGCYYIGSVPCEDDYLSTAQFLKRIPPF